MEIAIEEDEQTAMEWLERETRENGSGRADTFGIPLLGDTDTPTGNQNRKDTGFRLKAGMTASRNDASGAFGLPLLGENRHPYEKP